MLQNAVKNVRDTSRCPHVAAYNAAGAPSHTNPVCMWCGVFSPHPPDTCVIVACRSLEEEQQEQQRVEQQLEQRLMLALANEDKVPS